MPPRAIMLFASPENNTERMVQQQVARFALLFTRLITPLLLLFISLRCYAMLLRQHVICLLCYAAMPLRQRDADMSYSAFFFHFMILPPPRHAPYAAAVARDFDAIAD